METDGPPFEMGQDRSEIVARDGDVRSGGGGVVCVEGNGETNLIEQREVGAAIAYCDTTRSRQAEASGDAERVVPLTGLI